MDNKLNSLLIETDANPLDAAVGETTSKELVMQAILKAIASESGAICEYNQILTLIDKADSLPDKDKIKATIDDIKHEEEKHLEQLHECAKLFGELKSGLKDGEKEFINGEDNGQEKQTAKEDVKESILIESIVEKTPDNTRKFDQDIIVDIILRNFDPDEMAADKIVELFNTEDELTAKEVDEKLLQVKEILNILPEHLETLENLIIQSKDPVVDRINEFNSDLASDIYYIKQLATDTVVTAAACDRLNDIADELETNLQYDGDKDITWLKVKPISQPDIRTISLDNQGKQSIQLIR